MGYVDLKEEESRIELTQLLFDLNNLCITESMTPKMVKTPPTMASSFVMK